MGPVTLQVMRSLSNAARIFLYLFLFFLLFVFAGTARVTCAGDWTQFRGPNASGVAPAVGSAAYPEKLGMDINVRWKTPLPPGISSPCVVGDRVYLTGCRDAKLLTISLDRDTGKVLWERTAPAERLEEVHSIGSPATPTPASDGDRVYVFFGSYGLLAYDRDGHVVWQKPLGPFKNNYGQASSPILCGERVILNCDQDVGSFILAADRKTGRTLWETARPGFPRGFSTPILWSDGGAEQILVAGTLRLIAYDPSDGHEVWSVGGLARIVSSTPVAGSGLLFVSSYAPGGDAEDKITMASFSEFAKEHDANKDGILVLSELPEGPFRTRFPQIDGDKDGKITRDEWDAMSRIFEAAKNSIFALKPGGKGELAGASVIWRHERAIPYVPSPLLLDGLIYLLKEGAIFTCLDAATGKVVKQGRLPAQGNYYASPVTAGSRIYTVSQGGGVCILRAGRDWEVLETTDLGETCMATPALAGGRIYLRTESHLYCFGN